MHQLRFARAHDYSGEDEGVVIPVALRSGLYQVPVDASVDTGAAFCVFRTEIADALGLDLTSGIRQRFRTANSALEAYGHGVDFTPSVSQHTLSSTSSRTLSSTKMF